MRTYVTDIFLVSIALGGGLAVLYLMGIFFPVLVLGVPLSAAYLNWAWPFLAMDGLKAVLTLVFLINMTRIKGLAPAV